MTSNYSVWSSYFIDLPAEKMVDEFVAAGFSATEF